jgi:hypothetical protein
LGWTQLYISNPQQPPAYTAGLLKTNKYKTSL